MKWTLEIDKYTVVLGDAGDMVALRNGQVWRDLTGDKLVLALAEEVVEQRRAKIHEPPGVAAYARLLNTVILGHPVQEVFAMNKAPFACARGHRWWVFSPERISGEMPCPFCMGKTG